MHVVTNWDVDRQALRARNADHPDFGSWVAFASASSAPLCYAADRTALLGRNCSYHPDGFEHFTSLRGDDEIVMTGRR